MGDGNMDYCNMGDGNILEVVFVLEKGVSMPSMLPLQYTSSGCWYWHTLVINSAGDRNADMEGFGAVVVVHTEERWGYKRSRGAVVAGVVDGVVGVIVRHCLMPESLSTSLLDREQRHGRRCTICSSPPSFVNLTKCKQ